MQFFVSKGCHTPFIKFIMWHKGPVKMEKDKRIIRLLKIILILGQGNLDIELFAKDNTCTKRTVYRDISDLEQAGFPIIKEGKGLYGLTAGFNLKNMLTGKKK